MANQNYIPRIDPSDRSRLYDFYRDPNPIEFFEVYVMSKRGLAPFPTPEAKGEYKHLLNKMMGDSNSITNKELPIKIVAYSIIDTKAFFVFASRDHQPHTIKKYLEAVNSAYSSFFGKVSGIKPGYLFDSHIGVRKIPFKYTTTIAERFERVDGYPQRVKYYHQESDDFRDIFNSIALVNSQEWAYNVVTGLDNLLFSGFNTEGPDDFHQDFTDIFRDIFGFTTTTLKNIFNQLLVSKGKPERIMSERLFFGKKKANFDDEFAIALSRYNTKATYVSRNLIPRDILPKVVADLFFTNVKLTVVDKPNPHFGKREVDVPIKGPNGKVIGIHKSYDHEQYFREMDYTGYNFEYVSKKLLSRKHEREELLIHVCAELVVRYHLNFAQIVAMLEITQEQYPDLPRDLIILLNSELHYGYDFMMSALGFEFPSMKFLCNVLATTCALTGMTVPTALKRYNIYEQKLIDAVMKNEQYIENLIKKL